MNWSYRLAWIFFRALFATYLRTRFLHADRVPASGPVILASNHASFLDPPLIGAGFNRMVNYLARDTLFHVPIFASMLRSWKVVPVDRAGGGDGCGAEPGETAPGLACESASARTSFAHQPRDAALRGPKSSQPNTVRPLFR